MCPQKHYINCGIQTDSCDISSVNQSPLCKPKIFQSPVGHSRGVVGSYVPSSDSDITLANGSLVFESAYNQSPDLQNHDSPLSLASRYCIDRPTEIFCSRPSGTRLSAKRVLSLTSDSLMGKFKTTIHGDKLRLVSMPERGKYASVSARGSFLQKGCVDGLDDTGDHEQAGRPYPADLPQTPSPPSSPESITIIGNNTHVPGSLLRRPAYIDDDGWVSWANSPPRPIPALHGPSSLPYARCPSGAEGTLVEGDNLSHKIWGLGIDHSQMMRPPTPRRSSVRQAAQHQDYCPSQAPPATAMCQDEFALSHYYERDTVIDLSRPATFYGHVGTQRVLSKQNVEHIMSALPISTSQQTTMSRLDDVEGFAALQTKNLNCEELRKPRLAVGLGLHTWSSQGSRLENVNPICGISSNPLNTAAPTFVPGSANIKAYPSKQRHHVPQSEKPLPYTFSASRRPSIFNDAADQHRQPDTQLEGFLPTPPSTLSPCWTPIFSHQPEMSISKSVILTVNPKVSKADSYTPNIYSPISDLADDVSHIRAIMGRNVIQETDNDSEVAPHILSFQKDPFTFQAYPLKLEPLQVNDVSSCLKTTSGTLHDPFMTLSTNHQDGRALQGGSFQAGVGIQGFTERRRNLSYQQPRSIPLARLIQRRLSSVAEEDPSTKILFPFLQEVHARGFTHSKGPSLEPLGRQLPRIGLLDEEIFTTEMFSGRIEADRQIVYETESMPNADESNIVVKLPQKASVLRRDVDSNREKKNMRFDKATRQTTLNTTPTNFHPSKRHKLTVTKSSRATIITDDI